MNTVIVVRDNQTSGWSMSVIIIFPDKYLNTCSGVDEHILMMIVYYAD